MSVPEGEIIGVVGYQVKVHPRHRTRFYLPADNGLDFTWGTRFFVARSKTTLWDDLCLKLHPPGVTPLACISSAKAHREHLYTKTQEQELIAALEDVERQQQHRDDVDSDCIRRVLGTTPTDGLGIDAIAHRSGTPRSRVVALLAAIPDARRIDRWRDAQGQTWNHSGYFRDDTDTTPQQWQQESDYAADICDDVGWIIATPYASLPGHSFQRIPQNCVQLYPRTLLNRGRPAPGSDQVLPWCERGGKVRRGGAGRRSRQRSEHRQPPPTPEPHPAHNRRESLPLAALIATITLWYRRSGPLSARFAAFPDRQ